MKNDDNKEKPLIRIDDLTPKVEVKGGRGKKKSIFGAYDDSKKKGPRKSF